MYIFLLLLQTLPATHDAMLSEQYHGIGSNYKDISNETEVGSSVLLALYSCLFGVGFCDGCVY